VLDLRGDLGRMLMLWGVAGQRQPHDVAWEEQVQRPVDGHAQPALDARQSLEIYSRLAIGDAQEEYEQVIGRFPI